MPSSASAADREQPGCGRDGGNAYAHRMLVSPDQTARNTVFDDVVADRRPFETWLATKAVSTPENAEMVIAWKLSRIIGVTPSQMIRALRGQQGLPAGLVARVERLVAANPTIEFSDDAGLRRTVFVGG